MQLISDGPALSKLLVDLAGEHTHISFAVAWASAGTPIFKKIVEDIKKVEHGVIGTHFYQTDPDVLDTIIGSKSVHFYPETSGVFHPKVYYFWSKKSWDLVIGSANMTKAAFDKNTELSIHVSSADMDKADIFGEEPRNIIEKMWTSGHVMSKDEAKSYRTMFDIKRKHRLMLSENYMPPTTKNKTFVSSKLMRLSWDEYFERVMRNEKHKIEKRCSVLERAHDTFVEGSFASMSLEWRKRIAGLVKDEWGFFGHMTRPKEFLPRVKDNNKLLSDALDLISIDGVIQESDYLSYVEKIREAFDNNGVGVGIASRLLALKRPDYFVCLTSNNKENLREDFGIKIKCFDKFTRYWSELIMRIQDSEWWNAPQPTNERERRVWAGRAAMLDALYC